MWSNVVYFSTWRPHENWVSKTRFTTHINIEEPSTHIREKKKPRRNQKNPETQATCGLGRVWPRRRSAWGFFTQVRTAQVAYDLGRAQRNQATRDPSRMLPGFFSPRYLRLMVGRFFLPSNLIVVIVDFWNFLFYFFVYFSLYERLKIFLNFVGI